MILGSIQSWYSMTKVNYAGFDTAGVSHYLNRISSENAVKSKFLKSGMLYFIVFNEKSNNVFPAHLVTLIIFPKYS